MESELLQFWLLDMGFILLVAASIWLYVAGQRERARLTDLFGELGKTYEGQCQMWDSRQQAMERVTAGLTEAREQHENLMRRTAGSRSDRREAMAQLRAGMRPDAVAAGLEIPRNDVRLLAKVQSILAITAKRSAMQRDAKQPVAASGSAVSSISR